MYPAKRRGRRYGSRRGINEGAIYSRSAVAAAKLTVDADDLSDLGGKIREIGPWQFELGGVAPGRLRTSNLRSLQLEVLESWEVTHSHAGLQIGLREGRPEHMQGSGAELRCPKLLTTAAIQVEFDCIAVPDLTVRSEMGRMLIEAAQADVEVILVPEKENLPTPVGEVRMADVHRRGEGPLPLVQPAVQRDGLRGLRDQAGDGLLRGVGRGRRHRRRGQGQEEGGESAASGGRQDGRGGHRIPRGLDGIGKGAVPVVVVGTPGPGGVPLGAAAPVAAGTPFAVRV